jgi:predicted glutamine amidotransferase
MTGGRRPLSATFWLLEAPDSLAEQSRRNPDGYGIGAFDDHGKPKVHKRPAVAAEDEDFAREARAECSPTYVAHVRYASVGRRTLENTQPFEIDGRIFAHNGHIEGLDELEARLGDYRAAVHGDTDSERLFALISGEISRRGGDIEAGIAAAVEWVAAELPLFALNFVLGTPEDVWAFRYPDVHRLLILERASGGPTGQRHLDAASPAGTVRVRSAELAGRAAVIFASEQLDEDHGWRSLESGQLVRVSSDLEVTTRVVLDRLPARQLRLEDLHPAAAGAHRQLSVGGPAPPPLEVTR